VKISFLNRSWVIALLFISGCGIASEEVVVPEETDNNEENVETSEVDTSNSEYTIQFAHVVNPSTAKGQAAEYFADRLEEETEGRIEVNVYPDSQLGSDREITEQMQTGTIEMNAPFTGVLPSFVPQFQVYDLPYLFEDRDHAFELSNGELGEILNEYLMEQGLRTLGFWDGGFKQLTNSVRPIESLEDMQGLTMRASQSPLLISQFRAWGANGESVDFSELYTSLEQGTVDGQENPLSNIVSQNLYEAQSYITYSDHGYMGYPLLISETFFQELPTDLQEIVVSVADETSEWQWDISEESELEYMQTLEESSIEIHTLSDEEREAFRDAGLSIYDQFRDSVEGGDEIIDLIEN